MKKTLLIPLSLILISFSICYANPNETDTSTIVVSNNIDSLLNKLNYQTGTITINSDLATVIVPEGFAFLNRKDAQFILSDIWGNPRNESLLGMLLPKNVSMLDQNSWAVVYSYEEEGHIKDDDAEDIKYDELIEEMKNETATNSKERVKNGYQSIELIGWAQSPFYDKASHKLHWAKEIKFGEDSINTLNYNIRMLGRKGVLVMNIISGMDNISTVKSNINKILASTNFNKENRYEDFDSDTDKIAEYGIGGLIAGGILLKTGLLAKIGIFLLKLWKVIAIGVVGLIAFLKKKFWGVSPNKHVAEDESKKLTN